MSVVSYTVTGGLTDVTGHQSHVKLLMSIDQSFSTSRGNVHIVGSGVWNGEVSGSIITGSVDNITGTVHACVLLTCKDVGFSGSGNWTGTVTTSSGSPKGAGTFQGGLSFSNLKPPSTVPVTGNWTSTLNI
jgi:hypothetical protein